MNTDLPRWGLVGTLVWGLLIAMVFTGTQVLVLFAYIGVNYPGLEAEAFAPLVTSLQENGTFLSVVTYCTTVVCIAAILGIVKLRKGATIRDYFGIRAISPRVYLRWFAVVILFVAVSDLTTTLLGRPVVPDFMINVYTSADRVWMLWIALIIAAPLFEEVFFRGFLMQGLIPTFLGPIGAVLISAGLWAAIHLQYDLYNIGVIFVLGLILGMARLRTGSVLVPIAMHGLSNLIATLEAATVLS